MKIHKEGKKIIPIVALLVLIGIALLYVLTGTCTLFWILTGGLGVLFALVFWFFREPSVLIEPHKNHILSAANGHVVAVETTFEREYFQEERIQVSVFMSILDVHINFLPVHGEIIYTQYRKGRFLPAFIAKSSEENERCTSVVRMADGTEILIRQIAGTLARRVKTYFHKGDHVKQGDQLGFIRLGSRVDLFLPKTVHLKVNLHQKVYGGKTIIATFE
jgi:phosphatidylserine decarboxylase